MSSALGSHAPRRIETGGLPPRKTEPSQPQPFVLLKQRGKRRPATHLLNALLPWNSEQNCSFADAGLDL